MSGLGFLAVLTNATIITFVGMQMTGVVATTPEEEEFLREGGLKTVGNWE